MVERVFHDPELLRRSAEGRKGGEHKASPNRVMWPAGERGERSTLDMTEELRRPKMLQIALILVGVLLSAAAIVFIVFSIGMRRKTPWVLNGVRRFSRAVGNPLQMRKAGTPGAYASVIRHEGRRSGKSYSTPVAAEPTSDGFVVALVYGPNTDWLKNVLASGSATIEHEGRTYAVDRPEIVRTEDVRQAFDPKELRTLRRYRVKECLRLRTVGVPGSDAAEQAPRAVASPA